MDIEIRIENNNQKMYIRQGCSLEELRAIVYPPREGVVVPRIVAAYVDNKIKELTYCLYSNKSIRFVELISTEGMRVYSRSMFFLLQKAVQDTLGNDLLLRMMHPVGRGYYAEVENMKLLPDTITKIGERMRELVLADVPIVRTKMEMNEAIELFKSQGNVGKVALLETRPQYYVSVFNMAGIYGYFYGAMVPSTSYLKVFDVVPFGGGLVVLLPRVDEPEMAEQLQPSHKLFDVFQLNQQWIDILRISNVGALNQRVLAGEAGELIKIGEALQEKNLSTLADQIFSRHANEKLKLILISGPSSSGKTSFAKRLAIQLKVLGLEPLQISLDNYFVDRKDTPRDENGEYDYEALAAIDIEIFNDDLHKLFDGQTVEMPNFNFLDGTRYYNGNKMTLTDRSVIIVEGIHALNPALTPLINNNEKYKIYASALTALSIDHMSAIHTTDNRLLRRIVRDNSYRGRSAWATINGWASVRRGEDRHIFPYQEQADVMFNTALFFEFSILKNYAVPLLMSVPANTPEYAEALRLMKFLNCFTPISENELPPTSILREFVGGSSFNY